MCFTRTWQGVSGWWVVVVLGQKDVSQPFDGKQERHFAL